MSDPVPGLGAQQVGAVISIFLFGICTSQAYCYFHHCSRDYLHLRLLVGFIWILELGHTICICLALWEGTITNWGNPHSLFRSFKSFVASIIFSALGGALVQGYYTWRIYFLVQSRVVAYSLWVLIAVRFGGAMVLCAFGFIEPTREQYQDRWGWAWTSTLSLSAAIDVIICVTLCWFFALRQRQPDLKESSAILDRLIARTVETGLSTAVTSVVLVVMFQTMPDNFVWAAIYSFLAKLYSNSALGSLNSRPSMRDHHHRTLSLTRLSRLSDVPAIPQSARDEDIEMGSTEILRIATGGRILSFDEPRPSGKPRP